MPRCQEAKVWLLARTQQLWENFSVHLLISSKEAAWELLAWRRMISSLQIESKYSRFQTSKPRAFKSRSLQLSKIRDNKTSNLTLRTPLALGSNSRASHQWSDSVLGTPISQRKWIHHETGDQLLSAATQGAKQFDEKVCLFDSWLQSLVTIVITLKLQVLIQFALGPSHGLWDWNLTQSTTSDECKIKPRGAYRSIETKLSPPPEEQSSTTSN